MTRAGRLQLEKPGLGSRSQDFQAPNASVSPLKALSPQRGFQTSQKWYISTGLCQSPIREFLTMALQAAGV